jgi:hypothetical protein
MSQAVPVLIRRASAAHHAAALGVTGLLTKSSLRISKMFDLLGARACSHRQC